MDRLSHIIAFVTVGETRSFAETARRLNLANSVVSKRIKDLEDSLGVRLFERTTRHVQLTDAGYQYYEHARRLIDELAEVEENIRYKNENPVGELRVSAPMSFSNQFLGPALSSFLEKYPDVSVRLLISDHHQEFADDTADVAIFIGQPQVQSYVTRKIAETRRVVVANPGYLEKNGIPSSPEDLLRHNCITYTGEGGGKAWPFQKQGREIWQPVSGRFTTDSGSLLCEAALSGCGIAMLPTFIVGQHVVSGALKILLDDFELPALQIHAVYRHKRHLSARTRKFIDHISGYFSGFSEG